MTLGTLGLVALLAVLLIGAGVLAMAVGVMFKRPCLRGSCGGKAVQAPDGTRLSCAGCPNRARHADGPGDAPA